MGTGKADSANNRQALLAEMLGMMAHLGNNFEQSPSGAESHRSAEAGDGSDEIWLSVQAACDYVHVSRTTMYRLVREGKLPSHRIRGRILINRETLDRCIKDGLLA
ncbi:MAG: helix-turn-helix domain-containing protein [Eggerthellaceae bacterium]|nr:helix-turn-helix domain-containing protein [Eggerthellaceae bacterium]